MPRPTRRGVGSCLAAILLFLIGTNIQAGWLFVLGSLMLGAVVAGAAMPRAMIRHLEVQRHAPEEVFAGDDVEVDLVIRNPDRRRKLSITVEDAHIAPATVFVAAVDPHETVVVGTIRHAARRGLTEAATVTIGSLAPFGMARATRVAAAPGRTIVYPRIVPVDRMPELLGATKPLDAASQRSRRGTGQEFLQIREYELGDSLRHVHWPSTARHGSLMVREFEQEVPRRLGILLDTAADTGGEETALDLCCSVAGSVALHGLDAGHPVALAAARDGDLDAFGVPDRTLALTWLAGLRSPGGVAFPEAAQGGIAALGRLDTLVLAFPTWTGNERLPEVIAGFVHPGLRTVTVLIEAHTFEDARPRTMSPEAVAALARDLFDAGAAVHRVGAKEDLAACLQRPYAA